MRYLFTKLGNKPHLELFLTGFIHICLVAANTYLIAQSIYWAIFILSFTISYIWSYNVKKIAMGTVKDRVIYALGCGTGSIVGLSLVKILLKI